MTLSEGDRTSELRALRAARDRLEEAIIAEVRVLRAEGVTWDAIGEALHVTRQGAAQRYPPEVLDRDRRGR